MTAREIAELLRARDVHVRQYMGERRFEIWIDHRCVATATRPIDAESEIRKHLGISNADGCALEADLDRLPE